MKILTVVIPHKNDLRNLLSLIDTLLDFQSIDIIVVDDNSRNYSEVTTQLNEGKRRIVKLISNTGLGAGEARNEGLCLVSSPYVLFCDSDDVISSKGFSSMLLELGELPKELDIVFYKPSSAHSNGGGSLRASSYANLFDEAIRTGDHEALRYRWHVPWSKLFRTNFLFKYNIKFDSVIAANDVIFSCKSGHLASLIILSKVEFYTVIERSGSLRKQSSVSVLKSRLEVNSRYNQYLLELGQFKYFELFWGLPFRLFLTKGRKYSLNNLVVGILLNVKFLILKFLVFWLRKL